MQTRILEWPRSVKRMVVVALDAVMSLAATWLAFTLRLDTPHWPEGSQWIVYALAPALSIPIFIKLGLYGAIFRYTGLGALTATAKAIGIYGAVLFTVLLLSQLQGVEGLPRSIGVLQPVIFALLVVTSRALARSWLARPAGRGRRVEGGLLIYGAGSAGVQTAEAIASTRQYNLLGFVDDDRTKVGRNINAVRVYAPEDVPRLVDELHVTDILLAVPSTSRARRNEIIGSLYALPVHIRTLPGLADLATGRVTVQDFRELDVEDLLGRPPVQPDQALLERNSAGKTVLVTGAGGSIGSELSRQVLRTAPARLVLVDHNEFGLYTIHEELQALAKSLALDCALVPVLASVRHLPRLLEICRAWRPDTIYHAAAYKHVPMVEYNAAEGVANNVLGTLNMARAAIDCGTGHFVLISTDKAVRPTNVMGASKRVAELILQGLAATPRPDFSTLGMEAGGAENRTRFVMVRFGNVLGSSGSVVPLFRRQIALGGPVTVTHPEVTRYFMTVSEAAQLVIQAGAMAQGGEVFVLDMGAPVKIMELAQRMITLSGFTIRDASHPAGDIEVVISGLRPGEKLYEELLIGENPEATAHPRIMQAREDFIAWPALAARLRELCEAIERNDVAALRELLTGLVPGSQLGQQVFDHVFLAGGADHPLPNDYADVHP
jgi:FlaA1/EpsC-like NDP-sugar epimerase